jgi:hypothetical protein
MEDVHVKLNPGLPWQNQHSAGRKLFHLQTGLKFKEETSEALHLEHTLHGAETWTLRKVDQKYLERFEMWCWRKMEKIGRTERARSEVVHRVN